MLHKLNGLCYRDGIQISEREYAAACEEARNKAALAWKVYAGEISMDDVPLEWKDVVQKLVDERTEAEQASEQYPAD